MAWTDMGISPWPVMNMTGVWMLALASSAWKSSPLTPAPPRHSDGDHAAACHGGKLAAQKLRGRAERLDLETDRSKQASERLAHGFIVVDDEYDRRFGSSRLAS